MTAPARHRVVLAVAAAVLSIGWSETTVRHVAWKAVDFVPPDLARQIHRHEDRFNAGIRRGWRLRRHGAPGLRANCLRRSKRRCGGAPRISSNRCLSAIWSRSWGFLRYSCSMPTTRWPWPTTTAAKRPTPKPINSTSTRSSAGSSWSITGRTASSSRTRLWVRGRRHGRPQRLALPVRRPGVLPHG